MISAEVCFLWFSQIFTMFSYFRSEPSLPIVTHSFFKAGTGNSFFFIASVIGIALANKRQPALSRNLSLLKDMQIDLPVINASSLTSFKRIQDASVGIFHRKYLNLTALVGARSVYFAGYLQSYKYFQPYQEEIRRQFRFVPRIFDEARELIGNVTFGQHDCTGKNVMAAESILSTRKYTYSENDFCFLIFEQKN